MSMGLLLGYFGNFKDFQRINGFSFSGSLPWDYLGVQI